MLAKCTNLYIQITGINLAFTDQSFKSMWPVDIKLRLCGSNFVHI